MSFLKNRGPKTDAPIAPGERQPIDDQMRRHIIRYINSMTNQDFSAYTVERRHTAYPEAKSDFLVYDGSGAVVLNGREFSHGANRFAFWQ
jgi:hypothetical protein